MKFNYQSEKKKYIKTWERLEREYRAAGMSDEAIEKMKQFDWECFKQQRVYCRHNQLLSTQFYSDGKEVGEDRSGLLDSHFNSFVYEDLYFQQGRYDWIEEIDNEEFVKRIRALDSMQLEILTMYVFERKTHQEIAETLGIERSLVTKRIKTIKK